MGRQQQRKRGVNHTRKEQEYERKKKEEDPLSWRPVNTSASVSLSRGTSPPRRKSSPMILQHPPPRRRFSTRKKSNPSVTQPPQHQSSPRRRSSPIIIQHPKWEYHQRRKSEPTNQFRDQRRKSSLKIKIRRNSRKSSKDIPRRKSSDLSPNIRKLKPKGLVIPNTPSSKLSDLSPNIRKLKPKRLVIPNPPPSKLSDSTPKIRGSKPRGLVTPLPPSLFQELDVSSQFLHEDSSADAVKVSSNKFDAKGALTKLDSILNEIKQYDPPAVSSTSGDIFPPPPVPIILRATMFVRLSRTSGELYQRMIGESEEELNRDNMQSSLQRIGIIVCATEALRLFRVFAPHPKARKITQADFESTLPPESNEEFLYFLIEDILGEKPSVYFPLHDANSTTSETTLTLTEISDPERYEVLMKQQKRLHTQLKNMQKEAEAIRSKTYKNTPIEQINFFALSELEEMMVWPDANVPKSGPKQIEHIMTKYLYHILNKTEQQIKIVKGEKLFFYSAFVILLCNALIRLTPLFDFPFPMRLSKSQFFQMIPSTLEKMSNSLGFTKIARKSIQWIPREDVAKHRSADVRISVRFFTIGKRRNVCFPSEVIDHFAEAGSTLDEILSYFARKCILIATDLQMRIQVIHVNCHGHMQNLTDLDYVTREDDLFGVIIQ